MLTPFNVMLGIWPPGENWPLTLSGLRTPLKSFWSRSLMPRPSWSRSLSAELSPCGVHAPLSTHSPPSSPHVPTPAPGFLPNGLYPDLLHALQPVPLHLLQGCPAEALAQLWPELIACEALSRFSSEAINDWASLICCMSLSSSAASWARESEALGSSPCCISLAAFFKRSSTLPYSPALGIALATSSMIFCCCSELRFADFNCSASFFNVAAAASA